MTFRHAFLISTGSQSGYEAACRGVLCTGQGVGSLVELVDNKGVWSGHTFLQPVLCLTIPKCGWGQSTW